MKRHVGPGSQSDKETPESGSRATAYGSAIHDVLKHVEDGDDDDTAIQKAWTVWHHLLDPPDLRLLRDDLETYRRRDFPNTRAVAVEDEFRVPLFKYKGEQIYFRFKLDRLYERVDAPGTFIHIDYKSSRWAKSEAEVHEDLQLWAYNFGIHEYFAECDRLIQVYDQLRYGQIPTRKTEEQREQMREWLIREITTVLEDESWQKDGLLDYRFNEWCPWCPILESCGVVKDLTDYAATRIAVLAPQEKVGRRIEVQLDPTRLEEYAAELDKVRVAMRVMERYSDSVKDVIRDLPYEQMDALGYDLRERTNTSFPPDVAERLLEEIGPASFFQSIKVTKTRLESVLGEDPDLLERALALGVKEAGTPSLVRRKAA